MPTMNKLKTLVHNLRSTEAAEIAEAAMVLPLAFLFMLGIIWFGRAFNIYSTIQQAAQQGALAAAHHTCATCGNAATPNGTVSPCPPARVSVSCAVARVMRASSLDPTQIQINPGAFPGAVCTTTGDNITICRKVLLNSSAAPSTCEPARTPYPNPSQFCGTLVTFRYPFTFNIPFAAPTVYLTAEAHARLEN
jgi:TadE-like protein